MTLALLLSSVKAFSVVVIMGLDARTQAGRQARTVAVVGLRTNWKLLILEDLRSLVKYQLSCSFDLYESSGVLFETGMLVRELD